MYNRGFGFCGQGTLCYDHTQTENYSPFCDIDFMEYCLSIPLEWRFDHKIYHKWVLTKYPNAADYIWEKIGVKITEYRRQEQKIPSERHYIYIGGKQIPAPTDSYFGNYLKGFILRKLGIKKKRCKTVSSEENNQTLMLFTKNNMNPVDYWYYNNPELKGFMDEYWQSNKNIVRDEELLNDMTYLYEECKATYDKLQSLSVIAAYKLMFNMANS